LKYTFSSSKGHWVSSKQDINGPIDQSELRKLELERERLKSLEKLMEELESEESANILEGAK